MATPTKIVLDESELPTRWYNLLADLPVPPPPPLHPGTLQPVGPDDLAPLFPMDLIAQEVSTEQYLDIPGAVLDVYKLWRPSPLYRAYRLEVPALVPLLMPRMIRALLRRPVSTVWPRPVRRRRSAKRTEPASVAP